MFVPTKVQTDAARFIDQWLALASGQQTRTKCSTNADSMLGQRRRPWATIEPALAERLVLAGDTCAVIHVLLRVCLICLRHFLCAFMCYIIIILDFYLL